MENLLANIITQKFFNIGEDIINIILSYISGYEKVEYNNIPHEWQFITVFANRYFYKITLYEEKIELYFSCNKDLCILPENIAFDFAIQYSIFRYCKYYKQMISQEYTVDADGFQEYFYEELDFFINHFYTRFFFRFITNHLSKFNKIMKKYEYLRSNKYFCQNCHELFESGSGRSCECQLDGEESSSEDEDTSEWESDNDNIPIIIINENDGDEEDDDESLSDDESSSDDDSSDLSNIIQTIEEIN